MSIVTAKDVKIDQIINFFHKVLMFLGCFDADRETVGFGWYGLYPGPANFSERGEVFRLPKKLALWKIAPYG